MAQIQLVDENDQPLRGGSMDEAQMGAIWHRIVRVMVCDGLGSVLLQRRSPHEFSYPHCWDTTVGGHVDEGEDYLTAALREGFEEISVRLPQLQELERYTSTQTSDGRTYNRFNTTYTVVIDRNTSLLPNPQEVAELRWFDKQQLHALLSENPDKITDGLRRIIESPSLLS